MHAIKDVPEVENSVRISKNGSYSVYRYKDKLLSAGDHGAYFADASLFNVFDYKLLKGNVNNPFPDLHSIIITEATAKRFFGEDDPIGKILLGNSKDNYTVTGVLADFPENSSFKADILFSFELAKKNYTGNAYWKSLEQDWGDYFYDTYVLLRPGVSAKNVADKLTAIHIANQKGAAQAKLQYIAEPLLHLHLFNIDGTPAGLQTARIFLIVAVLILIIACINYVNLSTARAMLRSKEVIVRKIIGAERKQLFAQFIIETTLFFVIAVMLSLVAVKLLMPIYNAISGKEMQFDLLDGSIWKVIGLTVIGSLLASSIYPALLLSSFKPINALKGKLSLGIGNVLFRKGLVVTQFIFSIVLIIGTIIIRQQLKYIQAKDLGYDKSHVFAVDMGGIYGHYDAVRAELMGQPGVVNVTRAGDNIVNIDGSTGDTDWDGKDSKSEFLIHPLNVDGTYIKFFKLKIVAGRGFLDGKADSANFILNETAVKEAGIKDPIGKRFTLWQTRGTIIGVVKDFHFASLKQKIEPAILCDAPQNCATIFIRTTGKDAQRAITAAEHAYKAYNPVVPYSYDFLDADYDALYKSDQRSGTLLSIFAGIAIFISCLGLLGLATYTAQVKVKEISIRKVLGASVANITAMLSTDFLKLVGLSIVIAIPIAWYAMHKWLQDYAYPVKMHWWIFALAGLSAIVIAFATISFQAIKAALANPVKSLRSE
jgi:putative ABC transport system permease protein